VFHNVAFWRMKRYQAPRGFSSIIPHAYHVLHQGSSNECRGEYVTSTWFYRDMTPRQKSLTSHHYYELVILRYYRTGCPCQIMYGNPWAGRQCLVKPEHQWADSFAESAHLVDSARGCVHIQHQNEALIKIGKIHPWCYLCSDNFCSDNFLFLLYLPTLELFTEHRSQVW